MSEQKQTHLRIRRLNVTHRDGKTVIFADYDDGSIGTIAFDARAGEMLIDKIQDHYYGQPRSVPALDVTGLGMRRFQNGDIALALRTSQAGELFLTLPPEAADDLSRLLEGRETLPLVDEEPPVN